MNNNRRRNFRSRQQKSNFRRRNGSVSSNAGSNFNINGNVNFNRNGSMNNMHSVEKAMQKFQQLAKDAQSNGDPVLSQNYLQHADHYLRRYNELSERKDNFIDKSKMLEKNISKEEVEEKKSVSEHELTYLNSDSFKSIFILSNSNSSRAFPEKNFSRR